jgi:hypothetical protein
LQVSPPQRLPLWNRAESYLANTHRLELGRIENPIALPVVDLAVFYEEKI